MSILSKRETLAAFTAQEIADALLSKYPSRFEGWQNWEDLKMRAVDPDVLQITGTRKS